MGDKTETTWIGKLAVIPQNGNKSDAVIFDSVNSEVIMVGQGSFRVSVIKQIIFNENGKVSVKFTQGLMKEAGNPTVHVVYEQPRADLDVTFLNSHLDVNWDLQNDDLPGMHGLMGKKSKLPVTYLWLISFQLMFVDYEFCAFYTVCINMLCNISLHASGKYIMYR